MNGQLCAAHTKYTIKLHVRAAHAVHGIRQIAENGENDVGDGAGVDRIVSR